MSAPPERFRCIRNPVDHGRGTLLIGLDREAEAVPAGERGIAERAADDVERELEPVGFLGVDREVEVVGLGARARARSPAG